MTKAKKRIDTATSILYPLLFGIVIVTLWQTEVLHQILHTDTFVLPVPSEIISIMADNSQKIFENAMSSLMVILAGLAIGSVLGYLASVGAAFFPRFGSGALAILSVVNAIPIVALAPVIMNWTKDVSPDAPVRSTVAKIIIVTLIAMAAMSVNAYRGLTELKPFSLDLMKSYASSRREVLFKLRLPNSIPYVFTALRVSVPACVITALVCEYFAEHRIGVGRQIRENILIAQYSTAWSYILTACILGIALFILLLLAERLILARRPH